MFFLNQVWAHLDWYGPVYAIDVACMNAIVCNFEGEPVEWLMGRHDQGAPKLRDPYMFLRELRDCFRNNIHVRRENLKSTPSEREVDQQQNTFESSGGWRGS